MQQFSDGTPNWIGFSAQQELADEFLLAEVVKEVALTLRSRGVSHNQAMIEAFHTACDLIRQRASSIDRSSLAQITIALHIFCLAFPPDSGQAHSFFPAMSDLSAKPVKEKSPSIQEDITLQSQLTRTKRARGKHRRQRSTN